MLLRMDMFVLVECGSTSEITTLIWYVIIEVHMHVPQRRRNFVGKGWTIFKSAIDGGSFEVRAGQRI